MEDNFLLAQIAKLYYIDKVKQNEIATRYQITPMNVSRLLKKAEDEGIVSFYVKMPSDINLSLGKKVKDKYNLSECIVLNINLKDDVKEEIGKFTGNYILSLLSKDSIIGMSWGQTTYEFVKNLSYSNHSDCIVIQLAGGFMLENNYLITPSNIIKMVSEKLNCIPVFLNAPFIISTDDVKKQLLKDPSNKHMMELARRANINIIGASELSKDSTIFRAYALDTKDRNELIEKGALGEIAGFPIDKDGNEMIWSKSKLYTGVSLSVIKKARHVICLAGEEEKAKVLAVGMKKKYFNILITSNIVAEKLIELN